MRLLLASTAIALLFGFSPGGRHVRRRSASRWRHVRRVRRFQDHVREDREKLASGTRSSNARAEARRYGHGRLSLLQEYGDDRRHERPRDSHKGMDMPKQ